MITQFKIYEARLNDLPAPKLTRRSNLKEYKYKPDDIVYHIEADKVFIVKSINDCSDNQDYYLINPVDPTEKGFVIEEELRDAKEEEIYDAEAYLAANKYNL